MIESVFSENNESKAGIYLGLSRGYLKDGQLSKGKDLFETRKYYRLALYFSGLALRNSKEKKVISEALLLKGLCCYYLIGKLDGLKYVSEALEIDSGNEAALEFARNNII